jgi:hypothetical protein
MATPASPGSLICTLNASPSTRGISHSPPPPKSVPAELFTPEATVRRHGIVPEMNLTHRTTIPSAAHPDGY